MPNYTRTILPTDPLHRKLVSKLQARLQLGRAEQQKQHQRWKESEERTLAYLPARDEDQLRKAQRDGGKPTYTTIQIPYSYSLLLTAHTYWTSVFFARSPIHQFSGRHGEGEQQTQAIEALIAYQVEVGQMLAPYYIWLYDAGKYGLGVLGTYWDNEIIQYGRIEPMEGAGLVQSSLQVQGYQGNRAYNVSPFDFIPDPRVPVWEFQKGEFCAAERRLSWNDIQRRKRQGWYMNTEFLTGAYGTGEGPNNYGSEQLQRPTDNYTLQDGSSKHPARVYAFETYVDLIPSEWELGSSDYPEKWVFTITKDYSLIIGANPLGAVHGKYPFDVIASEIEGYGAYGRSIPDVMSPIQNTMDWLLNSHFYNVRAALNNQFVVDPSRVVMKDMERSEPGFVFRSKPEAYGQDIRTFIQQIPIQDITRANMNDLVSMQGIGQQISGISEQMMGSAGGTTRRTAGEVRTTTGFGVSRLKTVAEWMSATGFAPHAVKLVQTSQQYYDGQQKFRRVGDLAAGAGPSFLDVNPEGIAGQFDFVPVDGTLPVDRMAQAALWKDLLQNLVRLPPIMQQYDIAKMFSWVAQLGGLKNINQFKIEIAPDQKLALQAQAGNSIPMRGDGGGTNASNLMGMNGMGQ